MCVPEILITACFLDFVSVTLFTQGRNSMYAKPATLNFTAYFVRSKTIAGILVNYKKKHLRGDQENEKDG